MTTGDGFTITRDPVLTGDPEAGDFLARVEEKMAALRDLTQRVAAVLLQARQSPGSNDEALTNLAQLRSGAEAVRQGIYFMIEEAMGPELPASGTQSESLDEADRDQAWERLRPRLEALSDTGAMWDTVAQAADEAARTTDTGMIIALHELLPLYLEERGVPDADAEVTARLDRIEAPYLPKMQSAAALARAALESGWSRIAAAFDQAEAELRGQGPRVAALPGFAEGEQVSVA